MVGYLNYPGEIRQAPVLVAHRGGNDHPALRAAMAAEVDWLEVDVWWHFGRIVARHDPAIWRLPLIRNQQGRLGLGPLRPLTLDRLLAATAGSGVRLLLDLKGEDARLPATLVERLREHDALARTALCTQDWRPLEVAARMEPRLPVCFSLGRPEQLEAFDHRLTGGDAPRWISISHRLLNAERVDRLRERGVVLIAWTVNDPERARALVSWGVHGITSDSLVLLRSLRQGVG